MRIRSILLICLFPAVVMAQDFFEASGMTAVFTLKAGAKAPPVAIKAVPLKQNQAAFRIISSGSSLRLNTNITGTLRLYSLDGRMIEAKEINPSGIVNLKQPLKNGIYMIRIESNGSKVRTAKLVVAASRGQR